MAVPSRASILQTPSQIILVGDLICFLVFAALGLRSHDDGETLTGLLRASLPFQAGWIISYFVIAPRLGSLNPGSGLLRLWVPAWIVGLLLRSLVFGRAFAPAFAIVTLIVAGLLLFAWRFIAGRVGSALSR
jgi:hypothetical protein